MAVWIGLGWALGISANGYLLLGVPIAAAFQSWVARRPLHAAWVRDASRFWLDRTGVLLAAALAAFPAFVLLRRVLVGSRGADWIVALWLLAAIVGAVCGAFAFRSFQRATVRHLVACLATAGVLGVAMFVAARLARPGDEALTARAALDGLRWFLLYLPVAFVLEEVFFRGVVDAHVHRQGESHGVMTAVFVSVLWGLWHLPISPIRDSVWVRGTSLIAVHVIIGVPLSVYWRRSGNLAVPATVHAFINGVRNALGLYA
ncbi:MAG: CPBP family intramembrane glutamic endopeptidase [Gemmatimonadaceae bacterium]